MHSILPRASRYFNPPLKGDRLDNDSKERIQTNHSGNLQKYKKLHSHQLSQPNYEKRRPSLLVSNSKSTPFKHKGRFFTEQSEPKVQRKQFSINIQPDSGSAPKQNFNSEFFSHQKSPKMVRQRLIKQIYEREGTKIRKKQEVPCLSVEKAKQINSSSTNHSSCKFTTPQQLFKMIHNLTDFQIQEIIAYDEIYYYGQNCADKKFVKANVQNGYVKEKSKDRSKNQQAKLENYPWTKGDHINYRYEFLEILGEGSFGEVFKCIDHKKNKQPVALKIVKHNSKYAEQAKSEIGILKQIKREDPTNAKNCIQLRECFVFRQRVCMSFDLLSMNLYELVKSNGYYGLPLDLIRRFVLQILNAIHFLHKEHIIHADLKPQNILLKEANKSGVRIIDFGSSCFEGKTIYTYIQSRYYRAPEVILGMGYNRKIDIWSFGCIIAELHLGFPLFSGDDEHEQMCFITEVLGLPPITMKHMCKRWKVFFQENDELKPHPKKVSPASKTLKEALENPEDKDFVRFIERCLSWYFFAYRRDPVKRIEALDLLKDEWILRGLPQEFKQQHLKFISEEEEEQRAFTSLTKTSKYKKTKSKSFCIRENYTRFAK